jgi:GNAT superfamily N-acetyltransferase
MTAVVRRATAADAGILVSINRDVQALHAAALPTWFKPPSPSQFPPEMVAALVVDPNTFLFVGEVESLAAGYALAKVIKQAETPWRFGHSMVFIDQIGVRDAYRRRGVGRALVDAVRSAARDVGISRVALDVWAFNASGQAFFQACGFEPYRHHLWIG